MRALDLTTIPAHRLSHLERLEAESIHIMREVAAEFRNPVMLYSIGKDSSVMLHLAMKAFHPAKPPFPLLHVDTTWKFREMIQFRDDTAKRLGLDLIVHINQDGVKRGINPFDSGSNLHTQVMKTDGLKQALDKYGFDAAFGGLAAMRKKSRAKERIFSFRSKTMPGIRRTSARIVEALQFARPQRRIHPRLSALQLDRARHLAIHHGGEHPHRAALLRGEASGGAARQRAYHGR
jgi:3'-phosphoadenosine 5'-phosphosulfate sulfotransferase (PAPS reductase)/FAD synthetase